MKFIVICAPFGGSIRVIPVSELLLFASNIIIVDVLFLRSYPTRLISSISSRRDHNRSTNSIIHTCLCYDIGFACMNKKNDHTMLWHVLHVIQVHSERTIRPVFSVHKTFASSSLLPIVFHMRFSHICCFYIMAVFFTFFSVSMNPLHC